MTTEKTANEDYKVSMKPLSNTVSELYVNSQHCFASDACLATLKLHEMFGGVGIFFFIFLYFQSGREGHFIVPNNIS